MMTCNRTSRESCFGWSRFRLRIFLFSSYRRIHFECAGEAPRACKHVIVSCSLATFFVDSMTRDPRQLIEQKLIPLCVSSDRWIDRFWQNNKVWMKCNQYARRSLCEEEEMKCILFFDYIHRNHRLEMRNEKLSSRDVDLPPTTASSLSIWLRQMVFYFFLFLRFVSSWLEAKIATKSTNSGW